MKRVCFLLQLKKDRMDDYLDGHEVWPELLDEMSKAGITNYSLFLRDDGLIVGYLEAENPEEALHKVSQSDVSRRWEEGMAQYLESGDVDDSKSKPLREYFHMD